MDFYVPMIVDIVDSKNLSSTDRKKLQIQLIEYIDCLNQIFAQHLRFEVTFSAGDELQGLFHHLVGGLMYVRLLELLIHPIKLRAGFGVGEITVLIEDGTTNQQDGPAYHMARQALSEIYDSEFHRYKVLGELSDQPFINHLINVSSGYIGNQTLVQNRLLLAMEVAYPFQFNSPEHLRLDFSKLPAMVNYKFEEDYHLEVVDPIEIDVPHQEPIEKTIAKFGATTKLSAMLSYNRQAADSAIKRGEVFRIRNLDYVALQYMVTHEKGGDV